MRVSKITEKITSKLANVSSFSMFNRLVSPIEPIYRRGKSIDVNKTIKLS